MLKGMEVKKIVIDDNIINSRDVQSVIQPVWWSVSIYDGEERYESDLAPFTLPQRYVFAIQWYQAEVNNGGHCQFYDNPTGIVWEDAMNGFIAIGAKKNADIIKDSAARMGGKPSKDQVKRQEQMDKFEQDFDELDTRFYESEEEMTELLFAYIEANSKDFIFTGEVIMPVEF